MAYEATEELFDNLMKGLSTYRESDDIDSDEDNDVAESSADKYSDVNMDFYGSVNKNRNLSENFENIASSFDIVEQNAKSSDTIMSTENIFDKDQEVNDFANINTRIELSDAVHKNIIVSDRVEQKVNLFDNTKSSIDNVDVGDKGVKVSDNVSRIIKLSDNVNKNKNFSENIRSVVKWSGEEYHSMKSSNNLSRNLNLSDLDCNVKTDSISKVLILTKEGQNTAKSELVASKEMACISFEVERNVRKSAMDLESNQKCIIEETETISKPVGIMGRIDIEPLGIAIDPSGAGDYESVETITIDVNQRTQDEDEVPLSQGVGDTRNNSVRGENLSFLAKEQISDESSMSASCHTDSKTPDLTDIPDVFDMLESHVIIVAPLDKTNDSTQGNQKTLNYLKKLRVFSNLTSEFQDPEENSLSTPTLSDEEGSKLNCIRYDCKGCDSKFWILRFYYQHMSRVTTKILYDCKECKKRMKFTNPCLLKIHMNSHTESIKTLKLGESNLTVELPSINKFKRKYLLEFKSAAIEKTFGGSLDEAELGVANKFKCTECHAWVTSLVEHLMYNPNASDKYNCSSCNYLFSSKCALDIHERIHSFKRPYCCPECGTSFITRNRMFVHLFVECYHFRRCILSKCFECGAVLADKKMLKNHMLTKHRSVVYKCKYCPRMFRFMLGFQTHMKEEHKNSSNSEIGNIFDKCDLCAMKGHIIPHKDFEDHLTKHVNDSKCVFFGFKCRKCKFLSQNPILFQNHMETASLCKISENIAFKQDNPSLTHPLKKRKCDEFQNPDIQKKFRSIYSTNQGIKKDEVPDANEASVSVSNLNEESSNMKFEEDNNAKMTCLLCSKKFFNSNDIRQHIVTYHKCSEHHKYVQVSFHVKETLKKKTETKIEEIDKRNLSKVKQGNNKSRINKQFRKITNKDSWLLSCPYCDNIASSKEEFRNHVVEHREDGAYQCLECGECFVCKNPLEIHLVSVHSIKDTIGYISTHYVHNSLPKPEEKSLQPNQCSVCFDIFPDDKALKLHFRSHGMAFLRQNFAKRLST